MRRDPEPLKLPFLDDWEIEPASKEDVVRFDQPLKVLPKHGVFLWWPTGGKDNLHPEDIKVGMEMVPSNRVLTKLECEDPVDSGLGYVVMSYGEVRFRIKPSLWLEVKSDGYLIGDQVEIKSRFGKNQTMIVEIGEMNWDRKKNRIEYRMIRNGVPIGRDYLKPDFRFSARIGSSLDTRELMLQRRDESILGQ